MYEFEKAGGFVFPVTGNSFCNAQPKFMSPDGKTMLRDVAKHPGIFNNGGLMIGEHGEVLEKHALGSLVMKSGKNKDFIT